MYWEEEKLGKEIYMYDRGRKILKNTSDRGTSRGLETSRGKILRLAKHGKIASR